MATTPSALPFDLSSANCADALAFQARQVGNTSDPSLALSPSAQAQLDALATCHDNGICFIVQGGERPYCLCDRGWTIDSNCAKLASEDFPANRAVLAVRAVFPASILSFPAKFIPNQLFAKSFEALRSRAGLPLLHQNCPVFPQPNRRQFSDQPLRRRDLSTAWSSPLFLNLSCKNENRRGVEGCGGSFERSAYF